MARSKFTVRSPSGRPKLTLLSPTYQTLRVAPRRAPVLTEKATGEESERWGPGNEIRLAVSGRSACPHRAVVCTSARGGRVEWGRRRPGTHRVFNAADATMGTSVLGSSPAQCVADVFI